MLDMRILSGIQPTGEKHLGNYIGAIRHYVAYQDRGEALYFIADLHALTVQPDPAELRERTLKTAAILLAAGVDPDRSTLFVQSHVGAEHAEAAWMLNCVSTFGELQRMTQFKDKSRGKGESVSVGLFTYPVLQAADILLYDIDAVPVGEDQKQHLELTRNLAQRFGHRYGELFVVPEPMIAPVGGRIMDLQEPTNRMSTSAGNVKGTVYITDEPAAVLKKFKSAVTDSDTAVRADREAKPGVTNLLEIMSIATGRSVEDLEGEYGDGGYGRFKTEAGEAVVEFLRPVRERYTELIEDRGELERILAVGAGRAREHAHEKLLAMKDRVGLLAPADVAAPR
jgi:tryptophanyl-tRNA synthetase